MIVGAATRASRCIEGGADRGDRPGQRSVRASVVTDVTVVGAGEATTIIRMVMDLPEQLGPTKPLARPGSMAKDWLSTARRVP